MDKVKLLQSDQLTEKQKMLLYFFIYAFLGWILETIYCVVTLGVFNKRGFLYGPVCPIYGFGAVLLIQCLKNTKTNTVGKFFIAMISFTIFEYIASVVLEDLFGLRWWDYTNEAFNFQGRISLAFSLAWGIIGILFVEKLHPSVKSKIEKLTNKISTNKQIILLYIFLIIISIDFVLSLLNICIYKSLYCKI